MRTVMSSVDGPAVETIALLIAASISVSVAEVSRPDKYAEAGTDDRTMLPDAATSAVGPLLPDDAALEHTYKRVAEPSPPRAVDRLPPV